MFRSKAAARGEVPGEVPGAAHVAAHGVAPGAAPAGEAEATGGKAEAGVCQLRLGRACHSTAWQNSDFSARGILFNLAFKAEASTGFPATTASAGMTRSVNPIPHPEIGQLRCNEFGNGFKKAVVTA